MHTCRIFYELVRFGQNTLERKNFYSHSRSIIEIAEECFAVSQVFALVFIVYEHARSRRPHSAGPCSKDWGCLSFVDPHKTEFKKYDVPRKN
jgi:hypothetical protein